jgi:hypothetical protein
MIFEEAIKLFNLMADIKKKGEMSWARFTASRKRAAD